MHSRHIAHRRASAHLHTKRLKWNQLLPTTICWFLHTIRIWCESRHCTHIVKLFIYKRRRRVHQPPPQSSIQRNNCFALMQNSNSIHGSFTHPFNTAWCLYVCAFLFFFFTFLFLFLLLQINEFNCKNLFLPSDVIALLLFEKQTKTKTKKKTHKLNARCVQCVASMRSGQYTQSSLMMGFNVRNFTRTQPALCHD